MVVTLPAERAAVRGCVRGAGRQRQRRRTAHRGWSEGGRGSSDGGEARQMVKDPKSPARWTVCGIIDPEGALAV